MYIDDPLMACCSRAGLTAQVGSALHQMAESLGNAVDAKDHHTRLHSEEVAQVAHALALAAGCTPAQAEIIHVAGHLHDVGKIGIPDAVLGKKGPLTEAEWVELRRHPEIGAAIARPVAALARAGVCDMILHHHERYDGRGYPAGIAGEDIPFGARIISVADSLSAMLQNRPYRPAMGFSAALAEVRAHAGTQFDPKAVQALCRARGEIEALFDALRPPARPGPH